MFAVIRKYTFDPKNYESIDRHVREGFLPLIQKATGFKSYYWLDSGHGEGVSLSVFADEKGAEESVHLAKDYVHEHLHDLLGTPEVTSGEVQAHGGL